MKRLHEELLKIRYFVSILALVTLPLSLSAQTEEAKSEEEGELIELDPFTVNEEGDRGYGATHTVGGTRINSALADVPISVISLNKEVSKDPRGKPRGI